MILYCYGTRPEFIKIKKLIALSKDIPHKVLYVSQHKDIVLGNYDFKIDIKAGLNRLDDIISSILSNKIEEVFKDIQYVLVQGDTATSFGVALAAFHREIKVIHLEAGLRTYDNKNPYPEEAYRQFTSRITDIHLCPTLLNRDNLLRENAQGEIYVVGNTVIDNLNNENISYEDIVLITLHRRENHNSIIDWFTEINLLAKKHSHIRFILPIHPNPNVYKHKNILTNVEIINPVNHDEFINLMKKSKLLISDSGGIQEEAAFLKKKVIVCRKKTERSESINTNSFLCKEPSDLKMIFEQLINDYNTDYPCPYGDGKSSEKIIEILSKL